jgi:hypothetical protein
MYLDNKLNFLVRCNLLSSFYLGIKCIVTFICSPHLGLFITMVNECGQGSVLRDFDMIHSDVQLLPLSKDLYTIHENAIVSALIDGEPCFVIGGSDHGFVVGIWHAVTLERVRILPWGKEKVNSVCTNAAGTKVYFGTSSG